MEVQEPALAYNRRTWTIEEYLAMEEHSNVKHEYYRGEVFAMSGSKVPHNIVSVNLLSILKNKLKGSKCQPFGSDQRIFIEEASFLTYPDISIICGDIKTYNNDEWNILNPTVLIEVLSPSTKGYDRGEKFELYKHSPTLKEYLLVDPKSVLIEAWRIGADSKWEITVYKAIEGTLQIPSLSVHIPLEEIYESTPLP